MRLLLLLSALLSSLCGVAAGAAAAAPAVEASVSLGAEAGEVRVAAHRRLPVPALRVARAERVAIGAAPVADRPLYADRLRE